MIGQWTTNFSPCKCNKTWNHHHGFKLLELMIWMFHIAFYWSLMSHHHLTNQLCMDVSKSVFLKSQPPCQREIYTRKGVLPIAEMMWYGSSDIYYATIRLSKIEVFRGNFSQCSVIVYICYHSNAAFICTLCFLWWVFFVLQIISSSLF